MFRIIYPNRWFIWAVVACLVVGVFVWWQIELYSLDQELANEWAREPHRKISPTATNISTWKTYRNEKYGFEFQYPTEWQAYFGETTVTFYEESGETPTTDPEDTLADAPIVIVSILSNMSSLPLIQFLTVQNGGWFGGYKDVHSAEVASHPAITASDIQAKFPHHPALATFVAMNTTLVLSITAVGSHEAEFLQMIHSVKIR